MSPGPAAPCQEGGASGEQGFLREEGDLGPGVVGGRPPRKPSRHLWHQDQACAGVGLATGWGSGRGKLGEGLLQLQVRRPHLLQTTRPQRLLQPLMALNLLRR